MKFAVWIFTAALFIVCRACWCLGNVLHMAWPQKFGDKPIPSFTEMVLYPHEWLMLCQIPWVLCAAVVSFRKSVSNEFALSFAGTAVAAICAIASAVALAAVLPYLNLITPF